MTSSSQRWPVENAPSCRFKSASFCWAAQFERIAGTIRDETFNHVFGGPGAECAVQAAAGLEFQRPASRHFHRARKPAATAGHFGQSIETITVIDDGAGMLRRHRQQRARHQPLEFSDPRLAAIIGSGHLRELAAMIEGKRENARPMRASCCGAMQMHDLRIVMRALDRLPIVSRKAANSAVLGMAGAQPWRETTSDPQALPNFPASSSDELRSHPDRKPAAKPSPAPSTLKTSVGKPGCTTPSSRLCGIASGNATQPRAPRLRTSVAFVSSRNFDQCRSACRSCRRQYEFPLRFR